MTPAIKAALTLICAPALLLGMACGSDDGDPPVATAVPATPATSVSPAAVNGGSAPAASPAVTSGLPDAIKLERAFAGLSFDRLTGLYPGPDSRFYATEQEGRISTFPAAGAQSASAFLDITDRVSTDGTEEGLLGFALAPDFAASGTFYVYYSASGPRRSVISRFTSQSGGAASRASESIVLEIAQPFSNHNGGQIVFGPDGFLYVGLGDGGSARDPRGNGQNLDVLLGKILRIDVSGVSEGRAYRIPPDNPFVGRPNARPEIWAYGLRNPWRFSFDKQTGELWVGDVGQSAREEINVVTKGGNYGWNVTEGSMCLGGGNSCDRTGVALPLLEYATGANCSVSGGFVYRGAEIAALQGAYVYGDYCSGRIWALRYDGNRVTEQRELVDSELRISSFAQDSAGEIYVLSHADSGAIFKIVP